MDNKAIAGILYETAALLEIDGQDSFRIRSYRNAAEAIEAFPQQIADLIIGPKTIALIWSAYQVCDPEGVEKLAQEGKIRILPRMGEKHEQKLLKAIQDYRRIAGRFLLDTAEAQ